MPSQWETLQSIAVSHWLGANLESALCDSEDLVLKDDWNHWYDNDDDDGGDDGGDGDDDDDLDGDDGDGDGDDDDE